MKQTLFSILILMYLLASVALADGEQGEDPPEGPAGAMAQTLCTEPRPEICTHDYSPVCARMGEDTFKTYPNGCSACADPLVTGFREGACE